MPLPFVRHPLAAQFECSPRTRDSRHFQFDRKQSTPRQLPSATLISGCNCLADGKV